MLAFNENQLDQVTVLFERKLLLHSTDSSGEYVYKCPYPILAYKYRINSVIIPPTSYTVHANNNKIAFTNDANGDISGSIEIGHYASREDLLSAVDAAMTAASDAATGTDHTYTVVETPGTNGSTGTIDIAQNSGTMVIRGGDSSASELLGLGTSSTIVDAGATFTGPAVMRDDGADFVSVLSPTLSNNKSYSGQRPGNLITLPCLAPGQAIIYQSENAAFVDLEGGHAIRQLEIELRDSFNKPFPLHGSPPIISITFAVEAKKTL